MTGNRAALRYATALLSQAEDKDQVGTVLTDMQQVIDTLGHSSDLRSVLNSPVVKTEDKIKVLNAVFSEANQVSTDLFGLLASNKRVDLLGQIAQAFVDLYRKAQGIQTAKVVLAAPITESLEKEIIAKAKAMTGGSTIELNTEIDPAILGGFILRIGDLQYNASIANQFQKIKQEFSKSI
jgi:F-type H+-transporting ATPase subunit delta